MKENTLAPLRNYTKPVRIKDVALAADVSASTVSLVLNNKYKERQISDKVVQRVLLKARELGYVPNAAARQMRQKLNQITVSFISPFEAPLIMVNHWLVAMGNILKSYKTSHLNLSITVEPYHAGYLDELLHQTTHQAAIIANTIKEDDEYLAQTNLPFPVVLIGRSIPGYSSVLFDMKESGQKAAQVLYKAGCRKLATLKPITFSQALYARYDGFCQAAREIGLAIPDEIQYTELNEKSAFHAVNHYLDSGGQADGLFAISDILAIGAYSAIKTHGKKIPQDIAVVGFDGLSFAPFLEPPLTTFEVKHGLIYYEAIHLLNRKIVGEFHDEVQQIFNTQLVLRESTKR